MNKLEKACINFLQVLIKSTSQGQDIFKISRTTKLKYDKTPNTAMPLGLRLSNELEELEFTKNSTANFSLPNIPFWEILTPEINLTLTKFRKERL